MKFCIDPYDVMCYAVRKRRIPTFMKKEFGLEVSQSPLYSDTLTVLDKKGVLLAVVLALPDKKDWAVAAHESIHAIMRVFQAVGVQINGDNHEMLCYHVDFIMSKLQSFWRDNHGS